LHVEPLDFILVLLIVCWSLALDNFLHEISIKV